MRWLLLGVCVMVVACSPKKEHEPPPSPPPAAASAESTAPFVPDAVLSAFGDANTVFAIRFESLHLVNAIPMFGSLPCAAELLKSAGVGVFAIGDVVQGYMSKMPEDATKTCITLLGPKFGLHSEGQGGTYTVVGDQGGRYALRWAGTTLSLEELGQRPAGKLAPAMWEHAKQLPRDALLWVLSRDLMKNGPGTVYARIVGTNIEYVIEVEGNPDKLRPFLEEMRSGVESFYAQKGMTMEDPWAVITTDPKTSKLSGVIPLSVFVESNRRGNEGLRQSPQSPRP